MTSGRGTAAVFLFLFFSLYAGAETLYLAAPITTESQLDPAVSFTDSEFAIVAEENSLDLCGFYRVSGTKELYSVRMAFEVVAGKIFSRGQRIGWISSKGITFLEYYNEPSLNNFWFEWEKNKGKFTINDLNLFGSLRMIGALTPGPSEELKSQCSL